MRVDLFLLRSPYLFYQHFYLTQEKTEIFEMGFLILKSFSVKQ